MRKLALSVVIAVAAMAIPSAASAADGPPADVFTETSVGTETNSFGSPCGPDGEVTIEFHRVLHVTVFVDGTIHVSGNESGTFAFDPDDPAAPSSSGRYRNGFSFSGTDNSASDTFVVNIVGRDADGDKVKVQIRSHFTWANGELRVDNFEVRCG